MIARQVGIGRTGVRVMLQGLGAELAVARRTDGRGIGTKVIRRRGDSGRAAGSPGAGPGGAEPELKPKRFTLQILRDEYIVPIQTASR